MKVRDRQKGEGAKMGAGGERTELKKEEREREWRKRREEKEEEAEVEEQGSEFVVNLAASVSL